MYVCMYVCIQPVMLQVLECNYSNLFPVGMALLLYRAKEHALRRSCLLGGGG